MRPLLSTALPWWCDWHEWLDRGLYMGPAPCLSCPTGTIQIKKAEGPDSYLSRVLWHQSQPSARAGAPEVAQDRKPFVLLG